MTEQEARGMLEPFGALECVAAEKDGSMYIRYAYYLDCRDALRVLIPLFSFRFSCV